MDYSELEQLYTTSYTTQQTSPVSTVFAIIFLIVGIVGLWKVFEKAGEKGWKALIPIYSGYILFKIAGKKFLKYAILCIIMCVCYFLMMFGSVGIFMGAAGGNSDVAGGMGILTLIASIGVIVTGIWMIVLQAKMCAGLSRKFGHGNGFAAGLFFLAPIFYCILGFNKDTYQADK